MSGAPRGELSAEKARRAATAALQIEAPVLGVQRITRYDTYYYACPHREWPLPTWRIAFADAAHSTLYIDPISGKREKYPPPPRARPARDRGPEEAARQGHDRFGSGSIASQLTQHGLIDEYQFIVGPTILGGGRQLLNGASKPLKLDLLEARKFESGNVVLRYARQK